MPDDAAPPGERDLGAILAALEVTRRAGTWVVCEVDGPAAVPDLARVAALVVEDGATTVVLAEQDASRLGLAPWFRAAWLTVCVATALDGVGLTAALARALADAGMPCNVLAGARHDHLLVPVERADEAVSVLRRLRGR